MRSIIILFIALTAAISIHAQNVAPDQEPPESEDESLTESVNPLELPIVEFSVFVWPQSQIMGTSGAGSTGFSRAFFDSPKGMEQIYLRRGESTPLYRYQGEGPLVIYNYVDTIIPVPEGAPPGAEPTRQRDKIPLVNIEVPEDLSRIMIILVPGRKNADGTFFAAVMPYDIDGFEPGTARIQNNTKQILALKFSGDEGKILKLEPNKSITFDPTQLSNQMNPRVIVYGISRDNRLQALHTDRLFIEEDATNLFIIFPQGKRVRLLRLGGHDIPETTKLDITENHFYVGK